MSSTPLRSPARTMAEAGVAKRPFRAARRTAISCEGWQQERRLVLSQLGLG